MISERTLTAMQRFGGTFVKQLAALYMVADADNRATLVEAFHSIFIRYEHMAQAAA